MSPRIQISSDLDKFIGICERIPYKVGGRDKRGIDCFGLIVLYAVDRAKRLDVFPDLTRLDVETFELHWADYFNKINHPQRGCVFFVWAPKTIHCGIVVDWPIIFDTRIGMGASLREANDRWERVEFYEFK